MTAPHKTPGYGIAYAPYACRPEGKEVERLYPRAREKSEARTPFQQDCDRLLYAKALRRLEDKTQVIPHSADHIHNRSIHSQKVARLAKSVCRSLGLNEDLAEAVALAHDLGHTPFGHAGGEALDEAMRDYGGFDHNAQAIRIVTQLERVSPEYPGLNLTWAALEGIAKHNGPAPNPPRALAEYNKAHDLRLNGYPSLEAQISALCDDIAYLNHDLSDALTEGLITMDDVNGLPLVGWIFRELRAQYDESEYRSLIPGMATNAVIGRMVNDLRETTEKRIKLFAPRVADDIRNMPEMLAAFSPQMRHELDEFKRFSNDRIYSHPKVKETTNAGRVIVKGLFRHYFLHPGDMEEKWAAKAKNLTDGERAVVVCDYIAGMTDRYAMKAHRKIG